MNTLKSNIQAYFILIFLCFTIGQLQQIINNFSGVLGGIIIVLTAGFFFFAGGHIVDQGVFCSKKWKITFVVLLPIVALLDIFLVTQLSWYHGSSALAYYAIYTLGFLLKRLPNAEWVQASQSSNDNHTSIITTGVTENGIKYVTIGDQTWMAENLSVSRFTNGDLIPEAKSDIEWKKAGENGQPAWCYFENEPSNESIYGKIYNWHAVNDSRGLAPKTWKVANYDDWRQLAFFLGGTDYAGKLLKSQTGWKNRSKGTNAACFNALPGGMRHFGGGFYDVGKRGHWWTATANSKNHAKCLTMEHNGSYVDWDDNDKSMGLSVRCIKDD